MKWDHENWPHHFHGVRLLPVQPGKLEFARAVRAHLEAFDPGAVVVEIPRFAQSAWVEAVDMLPKLSAVCIGESDDLRWLIVEPADAMVEATRWAREHEKEVVCAALSMESAEPNPYRTLDTMGIEGIGYAASMALLLGGAVDDDGTESPSSMALAAAACQACERFQTVALVVSLARFASVRAALSREVAEPWTRRPRMPCRVEPLHPACYGNVLGESPFIQACWERGRRGESVCPYEPPGGKRNRGAVLTFPGTSERKATKASAEQAELAIEQQAIDRGEDLLSKNRLIYRLVQQAVRFSRERSGSRPTHSERRLLHRYAQRLALIDGRLVPDLFDLVVAARGTVDDRFARDLLALAIHWPWAPEPEQGVRLSAADLGLTTKSLELHPELGRLSRDGALRDALRQAQQRPPTLGGICSHPPEDLIVEALGAEMRAIGSEQVARGGERVEPFTCSMLDGLDARETLRRYAVDGRPWVRERHAVRAEVGAVVVIFDEEDDDSAADREAWEARFPWCEVWLGEHQNESDMAFFSTDPSDGTIYPGIYRAEYGGFLLSWPPWRLGDVWRDPAYRFTRSKSERLLVAALDYSQKPAVVYLSRRPPRSEIRELARRLGRRIVHLPPGILSPDRRRKSRVFHVLESHALRPLAERIIDPI